MPLKTIPGEILSRLDSLEGYGFNRKVLDRFAAELLTIGKEAERKGVPYGELAELARDLVLYGRRAERVAAGTAWHSTHNADPFAGLSRALKSMEDDACA